MKKCCGGVLQRSVVKECCGEVLSEVLLRSVVGKCCGGSVVSYCGEMLWRSKCVSVENCCKGVL